MAEVADRLKELIQEHIGDDVDHVSDAATLDDLGMDSLDLVELVMAVEEEYGVDIEDDEVDRLRSFGDMVRLVEVKCVATLLGHGTEDDMARTRRQPEQEVLLSGEGPQIQPINPMDIADGGPPAFLDAAAASVASAAVTIAAVTPARTPRRKKASVVPEVGTPEVAEIVARIRATTRRRRKKAVEAETVAAEAEVVETITPDETPEQKQTRTLTFDPFTLNGTEETPIFLADSESVRSVLRYDRSDSWRRRLAVCRGEYDGRTVYSFTKEKLLQFAGSIKKVITARHGTSRRHVEMVRIGARTRMPPELTQSIHQPDFPEYPIEDFVGRGSAYSAIAAAILGPVLRRKIIFVNEAVLSERGGYQIFIANHIPNRRIVSNLRTMYGIEDHNDYPTPMAIYESDQINGRGTVIFIQDQGINVAELHSNGLVILAQLRDDFFGIRIFHRILIECLQYLTDPAEYERLRAEMARQFRESQQQYIVDCATRALEWVERNLHDGPDRSANGFRSVARRDHLQQQIRDMERQLGELNLQLFAVSNTNQQATMDRIRREFDFLADGRFALISKVYFSPDGDLHITTDPIIAYDRQTRKYHLLGPCEIIAEFPGKRNTRYFGSSGGVRLLQYVQPGQRSLALPHCHPEGTVCWGNIGNEIASLLAGFELQALAALVITFLQRPNPFDRDGRRVRNFPETAAPTGHDPTPVREADRAHAGALNL